MKQLLKQCAISAANQFGPHRFTGFARDPQLWVLMYHRILPKDDIRYRLEEPGMIVTPETFAMHLRELKLHFDVIDLTEWLALRASGKPLPRRACAITFDDGWYDNYEFALPIIMQEKAPITLFAVVEKIATSFQFWPNLVSALLASNAVDAMKKHPIFEQALRKVPAVIDTRDREYMAAVIKALKLTTDAEIFMALAAIEWQQHLTFELPRGLMNWEELHAMASSGLVSVGSHTCNHKRLNAELPTADILHEVVDSKALLAKQLPDTVDIFCFPNGDYNNTAMDAVSSTYTAAVTTKRGIANEFTPAHQLCRIGLHENVSYTSRLLGARLSGWV